MRCHQMCRPEPNRERQLGPMHHSPGCHAGLLAAGNTLMGIGAAPQQVTPLPTAPRTNEAIRPAALKQELGAMRFVRKSLLKCEERVRNGHRPRSCSVGGSESSETWDNGISLRPCTTSINSMVLSVSSRVVPVGTRIKSERRISALIYSGKNSTAGGVSITTRLYPF